MTATNTANTAAPLPAHVPATPVVLFTDESSAVMNALPVPDRHLPSPLETLTWQEPPALEDEDSA
ncbi:hypothetical protein [Streptomyces subrutilus]|uniref:Uncharacterized protein n=1 Tax=Streptomyces subrutilus TaxID=36818 RepID=A0A1E5PL91_9ACTN|nr:hypothetical protein [Streptomyces subrutilus]OEJ30112.1 hypothetical protein BGK67_00845 [Streptomyces subrutilus]